MTISFTSAQIERFKREAKQLSRTDLNLTHSSALDFIAIRHGYTNWSLLQKKNRPVVIPQPFALNRSPDEMRQVLRRISEPKEPYSKLFPEDEAKQQVKDIRDRFISAENAVDYAIDYVSTLLTVPRLYVCSASQVYWEMRLWLPYCVQAIKDNDDILTGYIVLNRDYRPAGQITRKACDSKNHPNLHLHLSYDQLTELTPPGCSHGYLYQDFIRPSNSRKNSEAYLTRLHSLRAMLKS